MMRQYLLCTNLKLLNPGMHSLPSSLVTSFATRVCAAGNRKSVKNLLEDYFLVSARPDSQLLYNIGEKSYSFSAGNHQRAIWVLFLTNLTEKLHVDLNEI